MQQTIKSYYKLIKLPNILLLAFAQLLLSQTVVNPILQIHGFEVQGINLELLLLILATAFLFSSATVLGRYFDIKIDAINQPYKQLSSEGISKQSAMTFYQILTFCGLVCGLLLAYLTKSTSLAFIFIVSPGVIWFYSSNYKRQFLIGNLIFAFLFSLSILLVAISELALLESHYKALVFQTNIPKLLYCWIGAYAIFTFLFSFVISLVLDIKNERGARELEFRTLAVCWGVKCAKITVYVSLFITMLVLFWAVLCFSPFEGTLLLRYFVFGLFLPSLFFSYLLFQIQEDGDFKSIIFLSKLIFLFVMLSTLIVYYLYARIYGIALFGVFWVQ